MHWSNYFVLSQSGNQATVCSTSLEGTLLAVPKCQFVEKRYDVRETDRLCFPHSAKIVHGACAWTQDWMRKNVQTTPVDFVRFFVNWHTCSPSFLQQSIPVLVGRGKTSHTFVLSFLFKAPKVKSRTPVSLPYESLAFALVRKVVVAIRDERRQQSVLREKTTLPR